MFTNNAVEKALSSEYAKLGLTGNELQNASTNLTSEFGLSGPDFAQNLTAQAASVSAFNS